MKFFYSKSFIKQIFLAVVIFSVIILLSILFLFFYTNQTSKILVPNLIGYEVSEIQEIMDDNKLRYEVLDSSKFFVDIPNYSVISQIPKELELVKKNRKIYLNVNPKDFQKVSLPNVIQITKRNAESILIALGFKVKDYTYVDNIGKDMVLDVLFDGEKILPGQKIPMNSEVDLILGNGKK